MGFLDTLAEYHEWIRAHKKPDYHQQRVYYHELHRLARKEGYVLNPDLTYCRKEVATDDFSNTHEG